MKSPVFLDQQRKVREFSNHVADICPAIGDIASTFGTKGATDPIQYYWNGLKQDIHATAEI